MARGRQRVPPDIAREVIARWGNHCWLNMPGCTGVSDTSDHIVPWSAGGPTSVANLRRACRHCNALRSDRTLSGYGARYHAIIGPPCGGKSTWLAEHAQPGDIVLDHDALATCMTQDCTSQHGQPDTAVLLATGAWYGAYRRAVRLSAPVDVWIVKTLPTTPRSPHLLDEWIALDYEVIVCDPGRQVVQDRAQHRQQGQKARAGIRAWYRSGITQASVDARRERRHRQLARLGLGHADMLDRPASDTTGTAQRPAW